MKEQDYRRQLMLFPEDFPVNLFQWPENKKGRKTTDTYGQKCSELSESLSRVGWSVRTFLESCELPLPTLYRIWNVKDTIPSSLILKLRLSERRTGESASHLWPTAVARDWKDGTAKSSKNVPVNAHLGRAVHVAKGTTGDGSLNPNWVEWLMGYPIGWTEE